MVWCNDGECEKGGDERDASWFMIIDWKMLAKVSDVDRKFDELSRLHANGWVKDEPVVVEKKAKAKKKVGAARPVARPAKSNLRAIIAAARKNQMAAKSPKYNVAFLTHL